MTEYWDLYDAERNPLGRTIKRGDTFAEGEYYVCCEIWIQNSEGQFLMTQRHPDKKRVDYGNLQEVVFLPAKRQNRLPCENLKRSLTYRWANQN